MHLGKKPVSSTALPLQSAVLCVNCECVTSGRFDQCPICGSRSLLSVSQMLGGAPLSDPAAAAKDPDAVLFDLTITVELKKVNTRDVNAALERITRLIGPRLGQGHACFHTDVAPVSGSRHATEPKAA